MDYSCEICRGLLASEEFVLRVVKRYDAQPSLPRKGWVCYELIGFCFCQDDRFGNSLSDFDGYSGIARVRSIDGNDGSRTNRALFVACVVDDQFFTRLHRTHVLQRHGIGDSVPDGSFFALQIGGAIG